jgi:uncharacterized protein (TIGR03083 family)
VTSSQIWALIHEERRALADALESLDAAQWSSPSWCAGWSIAEVSGHVVAAAEQTFVNFYRRLAEAGFRFGTFAERDARRLGQLSPQELARRLRARTTTTNRPPAPTVTMLGEIVAHGEDIRRPLGLVHHSPEAALVAVANSWKGSNLLIGAKRRVAGLSLVASDVTWSHGTGPEVRGPLQSLILAMVGRTGAHADLTGKGLSILAGRA